MSISKVSVIGDKGMPSFYLNFENAILRQGYKEKNYIVKDVSEKRKCIIFFSSNGLYFPNEESEYIEKIIKKNYYEWTNIANSSLVRKTFGRIIWVRDIFKQWYVSGINEKVNKIADVVELLKHETYGYKVYTCGSSAGGYMASVVGALLQAELVFNFSGQWNIESYVNGDNELIYFYRNDEKRNRYYDIRDVVINSNVNVVYFYPSLCEDDIQQAQLISQMGASNICTIALKSEKHGHTVKGNNLPYIICRDKEWWEHFDKVEEGKEYSPKRAKSYA